MSQSPTDGVRRRALINFAVAGLVALVVVGTLAILASRAAGTREAIRDAQDKTELLAKTVVAPGMPKKLISGDPAAIAVMDSLMTNDVIGPDVARIKIWAPDGTIVYSDDSRLIGERYPLGGEEVEALEHGTIDAEVSDLSKPENRYEQSVGKMLEVYLPISSPEGKPLLFETYFRYDAVNAAASDIWKRFAPIIVGGLVLFALLLFPLAWRLTGRIARDQQEKERLLQAAIAASETERRRIASDLHDGVVQDLSGVALSLAAVGTRLSERAQPGDGREQDSASVLESAAHARSAVKALRSLLVEIYPPNLRDAGLETAIVGLLASLDARGINTAADLANTDLIAERAQALVFRVTQEGLRNVVKHADASAVTVSLDADSRTVRLVVADNGGGLDVNEMGTVNEGHVGLSLLADLAADAGGVLTVTPGETVGTVLTMEVPNR